MHHLDFIPYRSPETAAGSFGCQYRAHDFAGPADFHFRPPVTLCLALTQSSVDEPTESSGSKFPGRTIGSLFPGAFFYVPAILSLPLILLQ